MTKVLVTGAAGYIGTVMVERLLAANEFDVVALDSLMYGQTPFATEFSNQRFEFVNADVRDSRVVTEHANSADIIIPLAALVGAPICAKDPHTADAVNKAAVLEMFKNISKDQLVLMPTTNSAYGKGDNDNYCDENSPLRPISKYAIDKVEVENELMQLPNSVSFRLATVFGMSRRMRLDLLVNDFCYRAVNDRYLVLFEGHFKRNYIHVQDVVSAFESAITTPHLFVGEIFNVGLTEANLSKSELCLEIQKQIPDFNYFEAEFSKDPDQRDYLVSNEKIESLGWSPRVSLKDGIAELIKGFQMIKKHGFSNV